MQRLLDFFTDGVCNHSTAELIGAEIETSFVDAQGCPISLAQSQGILEQLTKCAGWRVFERKGALTSVIADNQGNRILYELGRQNIEIATTPQCADGLIRNTRRLLDQLYEAGQSVDATPHFEPILETPEDLLVVPDERDEIWVKLDGRKALNKLARISSVQFTFSVSPKNAIQIINKLGEHAQDFLCDYPQDASWREYITESHAGYKPSRYGGKLVYEGIRDYCRKLSLHDVVQGTRLVPHSEVQDLNVSLFLRSVWWHFRLRRYDDTICIEVRPMPRREDEYLESQLDLVLGIVL